MNRDDYLGKLNHPGAFQRFTWTSDVKPAAAHKAHKLTKVTSAKARTGVDYANLGANADRETGSLPWGEWSEFPYLVAHKGTLYARLYVVSGSVSSQYYVDDAEVTKAEFDEFLTPGARKAKVNDTGTITVKLANLQAL